MRFNTFPHRWKNARRAKCLVFSCGKPNLVNPPRKWEVKGGWVAQQWCKHIEAEINIMFTPRHDTYLLVTGIDYKYEIFFTDSLWLLFFSKKSIVKTKHFCWYFPIVWKQPAKIGTRMAHWWDGTSTAFVLFRFLSSSSSYRRGPSR